MRLIAAPDLTVAVYSEMGVCIMITKRKALALTFLGLAGLMVIPSFVSGQTTLSPVLLADNWKQTGEQLSSVEFKYFCVNTGMSLSDPSIVDMETAGYDEVSSWFEQRQTGVITPLKNHKVTSGFVRRNGQGQEYGEFISDSWVRPASTIDDPSTVIQQRMLDSAGALDEAFHKSTFVRVLWDGSEATISRVDGNELYTGRKRSDLIAYPLFNGQPEVLFLKGVADHDRETGEVSFREYHAFLRTPGTAVVKEDDSVVCLEAPGLLNGVISVELSKAAGLLPVSIETKDDEGQTTSLTQVRYTETQGGFYPLWGKKTVKGVIEDVDFTSVSYYYVEPSSIRINPSFGEDAFKICVPEGTEVFDPVLEYYVAK